MLFLARMLLLGIHFLVAGILGLLVGLCRPFDPDNSRICARFYAVPALWLMRLKFKADMRSVLEQKQTCVIIANHQSNYDLYVLGRVVPRRTVSMGKKSLKWVPLFGQVYWLAGNVLVDRGNARAARRAVTATTHALQHDDTSIWVFPEGTRSQGRGLLPFKKGAFQMAIAAGVPIIPVCVSSYVRHLRVNRWTSGQVELRALPAIPTEGMSNADIPALIERCHGQMRQCIAEMDERIAAG
ncbi:1-acylglycerol-3-phosphate O-acyltransferase [Pseudomonas sp. LRF_L74]|uniref:1-acylglycerol-3-phosphate O-acyltransferase n=1 Tax=Pseudomonas sp. LRF_L74 TaxID=3369422 RepID=UPI003F628494